MLEETDPPPKPELSYARNEVALVLKSIFLLRTRIAKLSADTRVARKPKPALATADIPSKTESKLAKTFVLAPMLRGSRAYLHPFGGGGGGGGAPGGRGGGRGGAGG